MVSGTDHQHRSRHLRTEDGPPVPGEAGTTGGKVDVFYCEVCLLYRRVPDETAEQATQPFRWTHPPSR
jgi:hypothetical protein